MPKINEWHESTCPVCGKNFIPAPMHAYKQDGRLFCSWTCLNKYRNNSVYNDVNTQIVKLDADGNEIERYDDIYDAVAKTGKSIYTIKSLIYGGHALRNGTTFKKVFNEKKGKYN